MTQSENLQALLEISRNNVNSISTLGAAVADYVDKVEVVSKTVVDIKNEMEQLKYHEEITTLQATELRNAVARKVYSLLSDEEIVIYGRKVFSDCWRYLGLHGCLRPYATTPKKDFVNIMEGLKSYSPDMAVIKSETDKANRVLVQYQETLKEKNNEIIYNNSR